ncbi:Uncharacterised protein [Bordetella pertussis]|nr:Uncharacterised protein [Bordetella pertussis]
MKSPCGGDTSSTSPSLMRLCSVPDTMPAGEPASRLTEMRSCPGMPGASDRLYWRGCIRPSSGT